jgi:hypothetical protein
MSARTRFNITVAEKFSGYGFEGLTCHLYVFPIVINNDYSITGVRATDSSGNPIVGVEKGDGQYEFSSVAQGTYVVVSYKPGIMPQVVNGYDRFMVLPLLAADEIACSATDATTLKAKLNVLIQYVLDNDAGWTGTPPTLIT